MKTIILASGSPRRKQLLEQAGIPFLVQTIPVEETFPVGLTPPQVPVHIAKSKAKAVWKTLSKEAQGDSLIIAADTVVVLNDEIIGKPKDEAAAIRTLTALSGNTHQVITGVVLQTVDQQHCFSEVTHVTFDQLCKEQIIHYVAHYRPFDKAGAYAIQEWIGLIGITAIQGDYYNVVGLPVNRVYHALKSLVQPAGI